MKIHTKLINVVDDIIYLSATMTQAEIAKRYNTNQREINKILKLHGIKHKKSRVNMSRLALNVNYFEKIDSEDKAYWLGFICADGNINKTNNKVTLTSKDLVVIESFKSAINAEHAISKVIKFDKRTNNVYTGYTIQITNEIFTKHLINLGITSNKTDVLNFPDIEEKYFTYFIAGLFDGDGSVSWYGKNKDNIRVSLISTKEMLDFIVNVVRWSQKNDKILYTRVTKNKQNVYKMHLYSSSYEFLSYIYSDSGFKYLNRKYEIFLLYKNNRCFTKHRKKIYQYDIHMNLIKIWNSQQEIANELKYPATTINSYLNKRKDNTYKNSYWRYENEY